VPLDLAYPRRAVELLGDLLADTHQGAATTTGDVDARDESEPGYDVARDDIAGTMIDALDGASNLQR